MSQDRHLNPLIVARYPKAEQIARPSVAEATPPLREVLARFATGVIVLTVGGRDPHGMTANAFSSVSLDPPQILCCVAHSAVMHQAVLAARRFAISIMASEQEGLARYFADKRRPLGPSQFDAVDWQPGAHTRAPLLTGSLGWLECELDACHDSGDHTIFIGRVLAARRGDGAHGLVFFDGDYHRSLAGQT